MSLAGSVPSLHTTTFSRSIMSITSDAVCADNTAADNTRQQQILCFISDALASIPETGQNSVTARKQIRDSATLEIESAPEGVKVAWRK